ncbi:hypothetical protein PIB30_073550 [Stylosanthes scabra]|uniref:Serine-threonine/tyrosine-protein kinase catalytic domain-containing protein n=1 Tax=Stylosanthes scabra TaxID=79078 RepID=A0ABU6YQ75_9FABA|nr:hypothetical protein [Stylosanthes scabra]
MGRPVEAARNHVNNSDHYPKSRLDLNFLDERLFKSAMKYSRMGYLDPCYVTPDNLSTKNDVFSFAILLFEIISGRKAINVTYSPPSIVDWAIPLIKKEKLLSVYDPRIAPPKDPVVRKQLALIAAKCVRNCREKRPSMSENVNWLKQGELSPLLLSSEVSSTRHQPFGRRPF